MSYVTFWSLLGNREFQEGDYFKFPVRQEKLYSIDREVTGAEKVQEFNNHEKTHMLARYIGSEGLETIEFISEATTEVIELKGIKACSNYSEILKKHCDTLYTLLSKGIVTECLTVKSANDIAIDFLPGVPCWLYDSFINIDKRQNIKDMGVFELNKKQSKYLPLCDFSGDISKEKRHVCFKYKLSAANSHIKVLVDDQHDGSLEKPYEFFFD